jgi:hypothetical protein
VGSPRLLGVSSERTVPWWLAGLLQCGAYISKGGQHDNVQQSIVVAYIGW